MKHRLIEIDASTLAGSAAIDLCDRSLEEALREKIELVVFKLPSQAGRGLALVDWLAKWQARFSQATKEFAIVADNSEQREALEFSHPDLNLRFCATVGELNLPSPEEVPAILSIDEREVGPAVQYSPPAAMPPVQPVSVAPPPVLRVSPGQPSSELTNNDTLRTPEQPSFTHERTAKARPSYVPEKGSVVSISGEFVCSSCNGSRMWLRGDSIGPCENPECNNPNAGWKLTYELF